MIPSLFHAMVLAALVTLSACSPRQESGDVVSLTGTEQLPVDRFDEYPAGALPPSPWKSAAPAVKGVRLFLDPEAESPFPANKVTGKGLLLKDTNPSAGRGQGIVCEFSPPPPGDIYLGFDFCLPKDAVGKTMELECRLVNSVGEGLILSASEQAGLRVRNAAGELQTIAPLAAEAWYHLGVTISPSHDARFSLFTPKDKKTPVHFQTDMVKLSPVSDFSSLRFLSAGSNTQTGSWKIDNISMGGRVDADRSGWLPFERLPEADLRAAKRKVFAYYYPIYSSGASSEDPGLSWYTLTVLNPSIPRDAQRMDAGTKLFYRPLLRPPLEPDLPKEEELIRAREEEIRLARQMGLDGFVVDFFSYPKSEGGQKYFDKISFAMLEAAAREDPGFKIIPAVYAGDKEMDSVTYANAPVFRAAAASPAVMRTGDGRMMISMWMTERFPADWWREVLVELERLGIRAALVTQFNSNNRLQEFAPVAAGMSHWGPRSPMKTGWIKAAREATPLVIAPVAPHDIRSRGPIFWEARNFDALRKTWKNAIEEQADWVFINTWSDYSEQAMAPSTAIGFAPYDLSAYYLQWFKTGSPPKIVRDVLYYSYRRHHSSLEPAHGRKWKLIPEGENRTVSDEIELLAFLKEPGELQIRIGGEVFTKDAAAGITSFKVPLPQGKAFTPEFSLVREGRSVLTRPGRYAVLDRIEYPNMLYHSGVIADETAELFCFLLVTPILPLSGQTPSSFSSVEQLPVDRFDEYPAGKFPPPPWKAEGTPEPGLTLTLEPAAESPFPDNRVHGKGFRLRDESTSAGKGSGLACGFVPAPAGERYLGFDFRLGAENKDLDLATELTDEEGRGLLLAMNSSAGLRVRAKDGQYRAIASLSPGIWYHLGVTISWDNRASFALFTAGGKKSKLPADAVPVVYPEDSPFEFVRLPALDDAVELPETGPATRLCFVTQGDDKGVGEWMIDNIAMAGRVDADRSDWLPFRRLPRAESREAKPKVLSYYYPIYSSGASSQDPGLSWYILSTINASIPIDPRRLDAGTKYFYHPLPRVPLPAGLSKEEELLRGREEEIRLARQMGLDGFVVDFFAFPGDKGGQKYFNGISFAMLDAAARMDPGFKIIPAVYAGDKEMDPVTYANSPVFERASQSPAILHTEDGRMFISMWLTERFPPDWWEKVLAELDRLGRPAALLTQFNTPGQPELFSKVAAAMSTWGPRTPLRTNWIPEARKYTPIAVAPVAPHDIRSRGSMFWEAENFDTLRRTWMTAIEDKADWVCLNTWSDYSEQAMAPSTSVGFAPYDISAYYAEWFKTGQPPEIVRDVLYYSYRRHHSSLEPAHGRKWKPVAAGGKAAAEDQIELLAFLRKPGELTIRIGDEVFRKEAPAGITSFKIPLPAGKAFTPAFGLERSGKPVLAEAGRYAVLDRIEYPNMLYFSGVIASPKAAE